MVVSTIMERLSFKPPSEFFPQGTDARAAGDWLCKLAEGQYHFIDQAVIMECGLVHGCIVIFAQVAVKVPVQVVLHTPVPADCQFLNILRNLWITVLGEALPNRDIRLFRNP